MGCRFPDCHRIKTQRFGLCNKHRKWVEKGYYSVDLKLLKPMPVKRAHCKISGCESPHAAKGFCFRHYNQFRSRIISIFGVRLRTSKPIKNPKDAECLVCKKRGKIVKGFCKTHYNQLLKNKIDHQGVRLTPPARVTRYTEDDKCKACDCYKKPRIRGWCETHYYSFQRGIYSSKGKRLVEKAVVNKGRTCSEQNCGASAYSKGLCRLHYTRKRTGYLGAEGYKNVGKSCSEAGCNNPPIAELFASSTTL